MRLLTAVAFITVIAGSMMHGAVQTTPSLQFEVAAVKPGLEGQANLTLAACRGIDGAANMGGFTSSSSGSPSGSVPQGRCIGNDGLASFIRVAYNIQRVSNLPDWRGQRYQIDAKAENISAVTTDELRQMLQALLADRFKLAVHREIREEEGYALVAGPNGVKFSEASGGEERVVPRNETGANGLNSRTIAGNFRLATLAFYLEGACCVSRTMPIVNQTGLTGVYDIALTLNNAVRLLGSGLTTGALIPWDPPLAAALEAQLGLRLEPRKVPVEYLVIDHVEMPTEN